MAYHSFQRCNSDYLVYFKDLKDGEKISMLLYVDELFSMQTHELDRFLEATTKK